VRHRQPKGADNSYVRPTATAPHLDSTHQRTQRGNALTAVDDPDRTLRVEAVLGTIRRQCASHLLRTGLMQS